MGALGGCEIQAPAADDVLLGRRIVASANLTWGCAHIGTTETEIVINCTYNIKCIPG